MTSRVVLAYAGDDQSADTIQTLRAARGVDVIAVALDLGEGIPLNELRDGALAAGATRCHALDAREEFLREAVVPTLRASAVAIGPLELSALATVFVEKKLHEVAAIEQAAVVEARDAGQLRARTPRAADGPAYLDIRFADGVPSSVNAVPMTLVELTESIETISGIAATDVLRLAYRELDQSGEQQVVLQVENLRCAIAQTTALVCNG